MQNFLFNQRVSIFLAWNNLIKLSQRPGRSSCSPNSKPSLSLWYIYIPSIVFEQKPSIYTKVSFMMAKALPFDWKQILKTKIIIKKEYSYATVRLGRLNKMHLWFVSTMFFQLFKFYYRKICNISVCFYCFLLYLCCTYTHLYVYTLIPSPNY